MKFTEGAFRTWGYEVAQQEFGEKTIPEAELSEKYDGTIPSDKVVIKDRCGCHVPTDSFASGRV